MTREIEPLNGPILELGPGTGVFTRAARPRHPRERLDVDRVRRGICRSVTRPFSRGARGENGCSAARPMRPVCRSALPARSSSGLPLLSMSPRKITAIVGGAFATMRSGGAFYQFTYGPLPCAAADPRSSRPESGARRRHGAEHSASWRLSDFTQKTVGDLDRSLQIS